MRKWLPFAVAVLGLLSTTADVSACEPCGDVLDLADTAQQADLIIVGQKVGDGPATGDGGPDWIQVRVIEILKGQVTRSQITVNSWDGMCAYGIVVDDREPHVMFLEQGHDQYVTVNFGCAVTSLPVTADAVELDGQQQPLDDFVAQLGPEVSRVRLSDTALGSSYLWYIGAALVAGSGLALLMLRKRSR